MTHPELFPESEVTAPSPRQRWKEQHGIVTENSNWSERDDWRPKDQVWAAWRPIGRGGRNCLKQCFGATETEALSALATRLGLKLWDEGGDQ